MFRTEADIRSSLEQLFDECVVVAMADGVVKADEQAILDDLKVGVQGVERQLMEMLNESHDEEAYNDLIGECFGHLVFNARQVALEDGIITSDEQAMLDSLANYAKRLRSGGGQ